jgi:hypothetical protein
MRDCCLCGDGICESDSPCSESSSSCPVDCPLPDLVVAALQTADSAAINAEGNVELLVRVMVQNRGSAPAAIFKVSLEATEAGGTYGVAFTVPGQEDIWYPYTEAPLAAGDYAALEGKATFSSAWQGQTVSLVAVADSCAGEEFAAPTCRVEESDEGNNRSASVSVVLPSAPPYDDSGPIIGEPTVTPELPGVDRTISIAVSITDDPSGVNRAELLYWYVPGEFAWVSVPMDRVGEVTYVANIGPFPEGGDLWYFFRAWDNAEPANESQTDEYKLTIFQID